MDEPKSTKQALHIIETFDNLSLKQRMEVFRELSSEARESLLEVISRPNEIMRSLSLQETYFTIKQISEEHALALITYTTGKQLQYIFDLELWNKEQFEMHAAAKWLEIINGIGDEKVLQFVQICEPELLITILHKFVRVDIRNPEIDLTEQSDTLPSFTLDDIFFVDFLDRISEPTIRKVLETIFDWNTDYYFSIMEELARGIHTEHQELAAKWRRSRLSEQGFPDFDDALHVYQYIHSNSVIEPDEHISSHESHPQSDILPLLGYPLKVMPEDNLFRKCLDEIRDPTELDRLTAELAHLGNKVIVADGRHPGSIDELYDSLHKVSGYINMALEELCDDDVSKGRALLKANHMEILFRRGFSLILDLRKEAQILLRQYEGGVENLGHPLAGLIQGLLQKRPYYANNLSEEKEPRSFETLDDIQSIRRLMSKDHIEEQWETI